MKTFNPHYDFHRLKHPVLFMLQLPYIAYSLNLDIQDPAWVCNASSCFLFTTTSDKRHVNEEGNPRRRRFYFGCFFFFFLPFQRRFISGRRGHEQVDDELAGDLVLVLRRVNQTTGSV